MKISRIFSFIWSIGFFVTLSRAELWKKAILNQSNDLNPVYLHTLHYKQQSNVSSGKYWVLVVGGHSFATGKLTNSIMVGEFNTHNSSLIWLGNVSYVSNSPVLPSMYYHSGDIVPINSNNTMKILLWGGFTLNHVGLTQMYELSVNLVNRTVSIYTNQSVTGNLPPSRYGHSFTTVCEGDYLLLFGGQLTSSSSQVLYNDVWVWQVQGTSWIQLQSSNVNHVPTQRLDHATAIWEDSKTTTKILFHGGITTYQQ